MSDKVNMFKQLAEQRKQKSEPTPEVTPEPRVKKSTPPKSKPKRGRPATGKRSDPDWIGRTYYIQKETDLDVQDALLKLKREGQEVDKSELVDFLLGEWVKSQQGGKATFRIGKNT